MKRIVIMADGKGIRWDSYMGIPKHLASVRGEKLISRTVRILRERTRTAEILVTSHDPRYEFEGSTRYEPMNNVYEIDRFTEELIMDDMCFLYGDTFYTEMTLERIIKEKVEDILFFGNDKYIVAIKIMDSNVFRKHMMRVKKMYLDGKLDKCTGWQVYCSFTGQNLEGPVEKKKSFIFTDQGTFDVNTPDDYKEIEK